MRPCPRRNSSTGEGGWALWRPLRTDTDRTTGRGPPEQNRQFGGHDGAGSSGGHGGAGSSGGHGGARGSGGHSRWSLWPWPRSPQPSPYIRNPFTPPQNFPGEVRGYQEPSGARHRNRTGQESPPGPDRQEQDSPQEQEALLGKLGSWGFFWAWHDIRGPHRVPQ